MYYYTVGNKVLILSILIVITVNISTKKYVIIPYKTFNSYCYYLVSLIRQGVEPGEALSILIVITTEDPLKALIAAAISAFQFLLLLLVSQGHLKYVEKGTFNSYCYYCKPARK